MCALDASLRRLHLVSPRFSTDQTLNYLDSGLIALLEIIGPQLETFHCSSASFGSTALRLLSSVKDLRLNMKIGKLQADFALAIPQTVQLLDLRWGSGCEEFVQVLLDRLQDPAFLPGLKEFPHLKRIGSDSVGPHTYAAKLSATKKALEDRELKYNPLRNTYSIFTVVTSRKGTSAYDLPCA